MRFLPSGIELPDQFGDWVLRRRYWILFFVAVLTTIAAVHVVRMPIQTSLLESFLEDPADYERYRSRTLQYGGDSDDLIYVATDEADSLFTAERLNAIRTAARSLEQLPEVERVTTLVDGYWIKGRKQLTSREVINRTIARNQLARGKLKLKSGQLGIDKFWPEDADQQARIDLSRLREAMLQDERTAGLLLSKDGTTQIMVVQLVSANDLQPNAQMLLKQAISDCVREAGLGVDGVYLAGMIVSQGWMFEEVGRALRVLFPIGLIVICLTVYALFHRLSVVVMTAIIGLTAIVWAVAAASVLFGKLSVLVAAAPLVILVISTSDVVHLATAYRNELGNGMARDDALRKVLREVGGACLLTSITTFVGFMSLMAIPAPSTRHLALAAAIGVASALLLAVTLVPIAFSFLPPLPVSRDEPLLRVSNGLLQTFVGGCRYLSMTYSWSTIWICAVLLVGGLSSLMLMHVDIDYARRFKQNHPLRNGMEFFNEKLSGSTNIEVFVNTPSGSVVDPVCLRAIANFEDEISHIPEVTASHSISILFRLTDQILKFRTPDHLPENSVMAESCVEVYQDIDQERLASMLTSDGRQTRISIQLNVTGFLAITDVAHRVDEIAQQVFPESIEVETSGSYPIIGQIVRKMVRSQMLGLATCFLSISVIMALGLRSFKNAMWAQFPNMLPAAMILGFLAYTLDIVDVDMLGLPTVALGLAVDDTIHFLHRYQIELAKSHDRITALDKTFAFTGQAILQTTMILSIGLLPFALGSFLTIWMLGTYLVVTLLLAVLADLLLLPALIKVGIIT